MELQKFLLLALFMTFMFAGIFGSVYRVENQIKIISTALELNECYEVNDLNLIICKKGESK